MKKVVLLLVGLLGGLYAVGGIVQFVQTLSRINPNTTYGVSMIAANVVPVCLGLIVCLACFQSAFRKPPAK